MSHSLIPVITVDGPSGSGKGTLCRKIADALQFSLLDSGALYRITAVAADRLGIDAGNAEAVAGIVKDLNIHFESSDEGVRAFLDGEDVRQKILLEKTAMDASTLAAHPAVRKALLNRQRAFRKAPGLVADGRDMGTTVFPDAPVKIFLTASAEERARRRYQQLLEFGESANLRALLEDIQARDARDMQRLASPLQAAEDAVVIDSTTLPLQAVFNRVLTIVKERLHLPST